MHAYSLQIVLVYAAIHCGAVAAWFVLMQGKSMADVARIAVNPMYAVFGLSICATAPRPALRWYALTCAATILIALCSAGSPHAAKVLTVVFLANGLATWVALSVLCETRIRFTLKRIRTAHVAILICLALSQL